MADKRELILARLVTVLGGIDGVRAVFRNQDEISERQYPCILILDADEAADDRDPQRHPNRRLVTMTPEIYVMLSGIPANVGTELNALRAAVIKAVFEDATLVELTVNQQGIRYEGSATGLSRGRAMEGSLGVSISFTYLLNPADL